MKKRFHQAGRGTALLLTAALTLSGCAGNTAETVNATATATTAAETPAESSAEKEYSSTMTKDKEESVYVKADASGRTREITVETSLKVDPDSDVIEDISSLSDIRNTKGDEEYTAQPDGTILWENHGEDISYKGTSESGLPLDVSISYFLDDKAITPEELAGKSGKLRMRFDYENHTETTVTADDKFVTLPIPFAAVSTVILPSDTFSHIEIEGGKLITMDDQTLAVGYALPGIRDALHLGDFEFTEDIDIPEYVEITADVTDFELAFTTTIVTSGLFSELDDDTFDDTDDLSDSMDELSDASEKLADGSDSLYEGIQSLEEYFDSYLSGVSQLEEGAGTLSQALSQLNFGKSSLTSGSKALAEGLGTLNQSLSQIQLPDALKGQSGTEESPLAAAAASFAADAKTLSTRFSDLQSAASGLKSFAEEAKSYADQMENITSETETILSGQVISAASLNEEAEKQASDALGQALAASEIPEEQQTTLQQAFAENLKISLDDTLAAAQEETLTQLTELKAKLTELPAISVPESALDISEITEVLTRMQGTLSVLSAGADSLSALQELAPALAELQNGISAMSEAGSTLSSGIDTLSTYLDQIGTGADALSSGASALTTTGSALAEGFSSLSDGAKSFCEGVRTFDEEGIKELTNLAGDDLSDLMRYIKSARLADQSYQSYAGLSDGKTGSVRFIIETDEIKK